MVCCDRQLEPQTLLLGRTLCPLRLKLTGSLVAHTVPCTWSNNEQAFLQTNLSHTSKARSDTGLLDEKPVLSPEPRVRLPGHGLAIVLCARKGLAKEVLVAQHRPWRRAPLLWSRKGRTMHYNAFRTRLCSTRKTRLALFV